jgi:hypothetical protein
MTFFRACAALVSISCSSDARVAVGAADIEPWHSMLRIDATRASRLH